MYVLFELLKRLRRQITHTRLLLYPMVPNKSYMNGMKVGHLSSDCHVVKTCRTKNSRIIVYLKSCYPYVSICKGLEVCRYSAA